MATAAGWHPDPQRPGQMRYWDGGSWTDQWAPAPGQPQVTYPHGYPQPPKKKGSAGKVLLIIASCLFGLCFLGVVVAAVGGSANKVEEVATLNTITTVPSDGTGPSVPATPPAPAPVPGKPSGGSNPPEADVKVTKCSVDETFNWYTASLAITNNSSKPSDYSIDISFESPDGKQRYAEGFAFSNNVPNGQTSNTEAGSLTEAPPGQRFVCKVAKVTRYASG